MAEKFEFQGAPKGKGRIFLAFPILGVVMLVIGIYSYLGPLHDPFHFLIGIFIVAMGFGFWRYAARPKTATITDISFRFERGGKLVFEAIWGEITLVKLGKVDEDGSLMLSVEFTDRPRVLLNSDLDFPEKTLEDIYYTISGIQKKYKYRQLRVLKGSISRF